MDFDKLQLRMTTHCITYMVFIDDKSLFKKFPIQQ